MKRLFGSIFRWINRYESDEPQLEPTTEKETVDEELRLEFENKFKPYLLEIDNLVISHKDVSMGLFKELMVRFYRKVYDLSASERNHHSESFGLMVHSLETVIHTLQDYHKRVDLYYNKKGALDIQFNYMNKEKALYSVAVEALMHDAGKIFDIDILSNDGYVFDATIENLYDFHKEHPKYTVTWKPGRGFQHDKRNILIFCELTSKIDKEFMNSFNFFRIVNTLLGYNNEEYYKQMVKQADVKSTMQEQYGLPAPEIEGKPKEDIDLCITFASSLKKLVDFDKIKLNKPGNGVYVRGSYTVIQYPAAFSVVLDYMWKHEHKKTTPSNMVAILSNNNLIMLHASTQNPILYASIDFNEKKPREGKIQCICIKNKYIWGCPGPSGLYGGTVSVNGLDDFPNDIVNLVNTEISDSCVTINDIDHSPCEEKVTPCESNVGNSMQDETAATWPADTIISKNTGITTSELIAAQTPTQQEGAGIVMEPDPEPQIVRKKITKYKLFLESLKEIIAKGETPYIYSCILVDEKHQEKGKEDVVVVKFPDGMLQVMTKMTIPETVKRVSVLRAYANSLDGIRAIYKVDDDPINSEIILMHNGASERFTGVVVIYKTALELC